MFIRYGASKSEPARKNLSDLQTALYLAKEMGTQLGGGQILQ